LFPCGFLAGWLTNVLGFRRASLTEKSLLSVVLSIAVFPIAVNLLGRWVTLRWVGILDLALILPFTILLKRGAFRPLSLKSWNLTHSKRIALWLAFAWVCVCLLSLSDLKLGDRLYSSAASYDHCVRVAFVSSAIRRGVPMVNPFYYAGGPATARYYYYWYVVCAVPASLFGLMPRHVLFASSVWSGFAIAAIIPLYFKHLFHDTVALGRKSLLGIALLAVTGLDLLPVLVIFLKSHRVDPDMDWWGTFQVTSWIDALLWVPHHVAALVSCLVGFLTLAASSADIESKKTLIGAAIIAALAFASAAGMSVYVVMVFALFLPIWVVRLLLKRQWTNASLYIAAGIAAIVISVPYLRELIGAGTSYGASGASFALGLRGFSSLQFLSMQHPINLVVAILMILTFYGLEFGFYGLIAALQLRQDLPLRRSLSEPEIAAWYIAVVSLLVATFVRSAVIQTNDLGVRSLMFAQFIFLLWGARMLHSRLAHLGDLKIPFLARLNMTDYVIALTLVLGISASLYQVVMLRIYPVLADYGRVPVKQALGADNFMIRSAYQDLAHLVPAESILQPNPDARVGRDLSLYADHQAVDAFAPDCGTVFGGSLVRCQKAQEMIRQIFKSPMTDWGAVDVLCNALSINVLVVTRDDAAWQSPDSWVWRRNPVVTNSFIRALACGGMNHP
jgi:hypothetical protein